jgi:multidrug efflux system outer membrane protein
MARADRANNSVRVAAARLAQARALTRSTGSRQALQADASASAGRFGGLVANHSGPPSNFGAVGMNLGYELDLFGKLSEATSAARFDERASASLLQSTRLLVQAEVAQAYLALRALDDERALVRGTVKAYQDTLDLTERRYRAGDVAELDVSRARTEVAATESDAIALDRRRAELENALAVLVGEQPSTFALAPAAWTTALPVIPAGVPSTVLARRPDVAAAQARMLGAQARVHVANAAWFPDISLTATGGYASSDLADLFKWSARAWGVGALLSLPLLDGGRRTAAVENAGAGLDEAVALYREQVLVAFRDVEDQLANLRLLAEQAEAQSRAVTAATRTTSLSDVRYRNGLVSQLDLLDARRSELRNRRQALQVRAAQYQATVGLVRALGGSWGGAA